ncbi:phosphoribosyltransferase [Caldivirga maquilingensis IC-167]|uniref:Phosphoribosyltransferase n=2 Tax=Caldivirga maquilingensis TaxID=76887 RepID=A8MCS4_CALMQ|nr:phosphoribosyltransferase [Caldivirga maquilingensis IC-167]
MNLMVEFKYLSWDDVMDLTIKVSESIVRDNYRPNIVVGVARGGVVIAKIIEDILGIGNMTSIEVKLYKGINNRGEEAKIAQPLPVSVKGLRVLLVDDVSDTGTTLSTAYNYLKEQGAAEIKTATLMIKPWTRFKPDYYADEATAWIIFPWELGETIRELGNRFDAALGEARNNSIVSRIRNLVHNTPTNTK